MTDAKCERCRFWKPLKDRKAGRCHKRPPAYGQGFPLVDADEWCGDWSVACRSVRRRAENIARSQTAEDDA